MKRAVRVPVIANGDIVDAATARPALARSGADGVMVGRGAQGRPWLLGRHRGGARRRRAAGGAGGRGAGASWCASTTQAMLGFYGRDLGLRVARKHLGWYLDGVPASAACARGC